MPPSRPPALLVRRRKPPADRRRPARSRPAAGSIGSWTSEPGPARGLEAEADLDALDRLDGHQHAAQPAVELAVPATWLPSPTATPRATTSNIAAERVARLLAPRRSAAIISRLGLGVERAELASASARVERLGQRGRAARRRPRRARRRGSRSSTPNSSSSRLATAPAATRAVVSRALARSRMSRASPRSYLRTPTRSAWPGRGRVTRRRRELAGSARRRGPWRPASSPSRGCG